jgi:hypothetical protein
MKSTGVVKKGIFSRILFVMSLRLVAVTVSGCAPTNVDHAHKAAVVFEHMPSEDVAVSQVQALKDADSLPLYGEDVPLRMKYHNDTAHADSPPAPADDLLRKHNPTASESKS